MQLAPNFYLSEFVKSQTALRQGIDNTPDEYTIETLERLAKELLQPVRNHFDAPVVITSGFRCPDLNLAIGSKDTSQHIKGEAVDFEVVGRGNYEVALYIRDNMDFDQLILEFWRDDDPYAGWVHCSYVGPAWNRKQSLTISMGKTAHGLPGDHHA
jgi:zinc D-Ala-D-Ala carboxypeptidase